MSARAPGEVGDRPPDDVDRIVAAWRRELPHLDVEPLLVLSRITRLARRLDLARGVAFATHHLESWEFDVLSALRRAGRPYQLSPGQLVTETLVTSGTMTNRLTRVGREAVDAALSDLLAHERELLGELTPEEQATLAGMLRRLNAPLEP